MALIRARFGEFNHGDENGPCGYSVCVSVVDGDAHHHMTVIDESRFGGMVELVYTGPCDGSCRSIPRELDDAKILQILQDPERKSIILETK